MGYCQAASDRFVLIDDPYGNGRICYKNKYDIWERLDLCQIVRDPKFLFIVSNVVYFNN